MGAGGTGRTTAAQTCRGGPVVDGDPCSDHRRSSRAPADAVRIDDVATGRGHSASCRGSPPRDAGRVRSATGGADGAGRRQPAGQRPLSGCAAGGAGRAPRRVRQPSAPDADDDQQQAGQPARRWCRPSCPPSSPSSARACASTSNTRPRRSKPRSTSSTSRAAGSTSRLRRSSAHINETVAALYRRMDEGDQSR